MSKKSGSPAPTKNPQRKAAAVRKSSATTRRRTRMIALEPRMLFDGALGIDLSSTATAVARGDGNPVAEAAAPASFAAPVAEAKIADTKAADANVGDPKAVDQAAAAEVAATRIDPATGRTISVDKASGDLVLGRLVEPSGAKATNEIVFIDSSVQGYEALL